ncbi:MAG: trans-sulfuration enzyme family protein [Planctomycetota bacterium]|jgi:cystathionine beta-lyase/cystathionine gamma-synthase
MGMYKKVKSGVYALTSFLVHGRFKTAHWDFDHHVVPPLSSTSTYRLASAKRGAKGFEMFGRADKSFEKPSIYIYERLDEPTRSMLEDRLACAEGGEIGVCFSTGMAAVAAALGVCLKAGEQVICHKALYGCTYSLLTNWMADRGRIRVKFIDMVNLRTLPKAISAKTRVVYFETPVNPNMEMIDISEVCRIVADVNESRSEEDRIHVIVDNTFATPFCQRPLDFGVDMVLASLTKNICGFGTDMGGVVVTRREFQGPLLLYRKDFGAILSSKSAWPILVYGLPSLGLRLKQETESAFEIAQFLAEHPKVARVNYPGLPDFPHRDLARRQLVDYEGNFMPGNMVYFVLKGSTAASEKRAEKLVDSIARNAYTITLAVSLGQIRTLIEKPASMTHAAVPEEVKRMGNIDPGGIRLSVGIEETADIIKDLNNALNAV